MAITENCHQWLSLLICALVVLQTRAAFETFPLLIPENAKATGAVCLDGSPGAYHLIEARTPENKDHWLIYMEGGGWCQNIEECYSRTQEHKGSSRHMMKNAEFPKDVDFPYGGIVNLGPSYNPTEFRKWNIVIMRYCDGSSFIGDVEQPVDNLYFRGKRIFEAITSELLRKGLKNAKQVFLTGGSAGGVSVVLNCDRLGKLLPKTAKFKCLSDGGYFIDAKKNPKQAEGFVSMFKDVVSLHNSTGMLPQTCVEKMKDKPYLCMFPQYVVEDMVTPIFILMSPYDSYQMNITLLHDTYYDVYDAYKDHVKLPTSTYEVLKDFRLQFLDALPPIKPTNGFFINNCFGHTELTSTTWNIEGDNVDNVRDVTAISDWYFDQRQVHLIEKSDLVKICEQNGYLA